MYEIKVDGLDKLVTKMEAYKNQITDLHKQVPAELVEWQRVDMRRHYPNIEVDEGPEATAATTRVWPRSRLETQLGHTRVTQPIVQKGPKQYRQVLRAPRGAAARWRPILRMELFRKLIERMEKIGSEALKWP
jgi:hypothetical protein